MTFEQERAWGQTLIGKNLELCFPPACVARPAQYQPVVGVKESGDISNDLLGTCYEINDLAFVLL